MSHEAKPQLQPTGDGSGEVCFLPLICRTLANRCDSPRMPFKWTINPYRGCEFACRYCYARYTHEFLGARDPLAFEKDIYVKEDAAAALRADLARRVRPGEPIAMGTATDPYQPAERRYQVTRAVLEVFAAQRGHDLSITTKSSLIRRDVDLLRRIGEKNSLHVNVSLITLDRKLARRLEPRAPRPRRRLQTIERLHRAGIEVGLFLMPVLPGLTDDFSTIRRVIAAAARAGASFVASSTLFLRQPSRSYFFQYLAEHHPDKLPSYRRAYRSSAYLSPAYRRRVRSRVEAAANQQGIAADRPMPSNHPRQAQLRLAL